MLLDKFFPKVFVDSIYHIDYSDLLKSGVTFLIFDIDNTLAPFDIKEPSEKLVKYLKHLEGLGFKVSLLSNNSKKRVSIFNNKLNYNAIHKAKKPLTKALKTTLTYFNSTPEQTAIIGDQIFTDIFGGNRLGLYTILVKPIANRDEFTVKLKRSIESLVIDQYLKHNNNN